MTDSKKNRPKRGSVHLDEFSEKFESLPRELRWIAVHANSGALNTRSPGIWRILGIREVKP